MNDLIKDPGAHISVKSKNKKTQVCTSDFANQLRRLKYLLNEPDFKEPQSSNQLIYPMTVQFLRNFNLH